MDWDDLRVFLAVAREDSLARAGKRLGMDGSTAARRIARLEEAMGATLFRKTPQGYALLPAGERLLPHAETVEASLAAAEATIEPPGLSGQLRIGAPDGCATFVLPQVSAALCAAHPGLDIQIVSLPRVANLSRREADLAITVSAPSTGRLSVQKLCDYHLHLVGSRSYLDRFGPIHSPEDLRGAALVGYIPDMIFDRELDYLSQIEALTGTEPVLTSNAASVQLAMLRAGAGLGVAHDFALPFAPELVPVLSQHIALRRSFWLVRHEDDRRSARMNHLVEALGAALRREVARLEDAAGIS